MIILMTHTKTTQDRPWIHATGNRDFEVIYIVDAYFFMEERTLFPFFHRKLHV